MAGKKNDPLEPQVYLERKSDPVYTKEERRYVISHLFTERAIAKRLKKGLLLYEAASIDEMETMVTTHERQIRDGWKRGSLLRAETFANKKAEWVINAVQQFGIDALRLSPLDEKIVRDKIDQDIRYQLLEALDRLGVEVFRVIRFWRDRAEKGNLQERREATLRLRTVQKQLVPKTRGKRKKILRAPPSEVLVRYYQELFRAYHIQHSLEAGRGTGSERIKRASKNFKMPIKDLRWFLGLDDDYNPYMQRHSLKDIARNLTCQHFEITQQHLHNLLSKWV